MTPPSPRRAGARKFVRPLSQVVTLRHVEPQAATVVMSERYDATGRIRPQWIDGGSLLNARA